jgi:hypothetical protein
MYFVCNLDWAGTEDRLCRYQDGGTGFTDYPNTRTLDSGNNIFSFDFLNDDVYLNSYDDDWSSNLYKLSGGVFTQMADTYPGAGNQDYVGNVTVINGIIYFSANDAAGLQKLFKFDPSGPTVTQISDTRPGWDDNLSQFTKVGNHLFLSMVSPLGYYLYMYDGVSPSVVQVSNTSGGANDQPNIHGYFYGKLYYNGIDGVGNVRNFTIQSDGSAETQLPIVNPAMSDNFQNYVAYNSKLYMAGWTPDTGYMDFYSYDPVGNTFDLLKSVNGLKSDSDTARLETTSFGVFFRAQKEISGVSYKVPYLMDSAETVTHLQGEGEGDDGVSGMWYVNNKFYLLKYNADFEKKLYEHNLTTGVETQMCDMNLGRDDAIFQLFNSSGHLYAAAYSQSATDVKLIKCELGVATVVSNINVGGSDGINALAQVGNTVYFDAFTNAMFHKKMYKFSHTGGLVGPLTNLNGGGSDAIYDLIADETNGKVYFVGDPGLGNKLYEIDTTSDVVTQVSDVFAGNSDNPDPMLLFENKLYFTADNAAGFTKLYVYNPAAPVLVTTPLFEVNPGGTEPVVSLRGLSGKLYMNINPDWNGTNLYEYNVGTGMTTMAYVINGGSYNNSNLLEVVNNSVYFAPLDVSGFRSVHRYHSSSKNQVFTSTANGDDETGFMNVHSTALITLSKDSDGFERFHYFDGTYSGVVGKVNVGMDDAAMVYPVSIPGVGYMIQLSKDQSGYFSNSAYLWGFP